MGNSETSLREAELPSDLSLLLNDCHKVPFGKSGMTLRRWFWSPEAVSVHFLETAHDYIQYILPIDTKSQYNPDSPVVAEKDIWSMPFGMTQTDSIVKAATMMLSFWGIVIGRFQAPTSSQDAWSINKPLSQYGLTLVLSDDASKALANVAEKPHNILRMTRLVKCLRLFGLFAFATEALLMLNQILKMASELNTRTVNTYEGVSVFIVKGNGTAEQNIFFNKYLAEEYSLLALERDSDTERLYFESIADTNKSDFLDHIRHVQKIWQ